jgi:hypothetical protein
MSCPFIRLPDVCLGKIREKSGRQALQVVTHPRMFILLLRAPRDLGFGQR